MQISRRERIWRKKILRFVCPASRSASAIPGLNLRSPNYRESSSPLSRLLLSTVFLGDTSRYRRPRCFSDGELKACL